MKKSIETFASLSAQAMQTLKGGTGDKTNPDKQTPIGDKPIDDSKNNPIKH